MKIKLDGIMVLVIMVIIVLVYLSSKAEAVIDGLTPTNPDNVFNQGAVAVMGQDLLQTLGLPLFKIVDFVTGRE